MGEFLLLFGLLVGQNTVFEDIILGGELKVFTINIEIINTSVHNDKFVIAVPDGLNHK